MDAISRDFDNKCLRLIAVHKKLDTSRNYTLNRLQLMKEELLNFLRVGIGAAINTPMDIISAMTNIILTETEKIFVNEAFTKVNPLCVVNYANLEEVANIIDQEIARVEAMYQDVFSQIEQAKEMLLNIMSIIEGFVLAKDTLKLKTLEVQEEYAKAMDELLREQEQIAADPDLQEEDRILLLEQLTQRIEEKELEYKNDVKSLKEQIRSVDNNIQEKANQASTIVKKYETLPPVNALKIPEKSQFSLVRENEIQMLEKQIKDLQVATYKTKRPSETVAINKQIKELRDKLTELKHKDQLSKIEKHLHLKGIYVSSQCNFINTSGSVITEKEARNMGLLEGIPSELVLDLFETKAQPPPPLSESSSAGSKQSLLSSEDVDYLKKTMGKPLTLALAEITSTQPRDPIHYLAHWLIKYRYNQDLDVMSAKETEELTAERTRIAQETLRRMIESEARQAILDIILKVEQTVLEKEIAARALLAAEEEEENVYEEFIPDN